MLGLFDNTRHMPESAEPKKYVRPVRPEAVRRGELLAQLMEDLKIDRTELANDSGVSGQTIWLYLKGKSDIANATQETADALLRTLGIPDTHAWVALDIPTEKRDTFRSFRPPPMGHGEDLRELQDIILEHPMQGSITLPPGYLVQIDASNMADGLQLLKLDDRYLLGPSSVLPAQGQRLGQLVSIDTAIAPL